MLNFRGIITEKKSHNITMKSDRHSNDTNNSLFFLDINLMEPHTEDDG